MPPRGGDPQARGRPELRAIAFDLFTIFDPRLVDRRAGAVAGGNPQLAATWKARLFEYSWIRASSGQYADFEQLVHDSLLYATEAHGIALAPSALAELEATFTELEPWPDAPATLHALRASGLRMAPLANFAPRMIERLLRRVGLYEAFDDWISTDRARTYKPDPRAYALAETAFGLPRRSIAFAAFGGWDAAGARWFGFPSFWVNRLGVPAERLLAADASGPDLPALATWVSSLKSE
jgi:2-haloacid dehalogenase